MRSSVRGPRLKLRATHVGSVRPAAWRTRPQYVVKSYCDSGSARIPGSEADIIPVRSTDCVFHQQITEAGEGERGSCTVTLQRMSPSYKRRKERAT